MAANPYWIDHRLDSQRVSARTLPTFSPARELSRELIGTRAEVRRRGGIVPAWVIFGIVFAAAFALCVNVTVRTRAEVQSASSQYDRISSDVKQLRAENAALEQEVHRLNTDARAIEMAARTRLNMVRANEIVVPVE